MTQLQIYCGTVSGWQPAGSGRAVTADRAGYLLQLFQRINGQERLYRIAPVRLPGESLESALFAAGRQSTGAQLPTLRSC